MIETGLAALRATYYGSRIWKMASESGTAKNYKAKVQKIEHARRMDDAGKKLDAELRALNKEQQVKNENDTMRDALKGDMAKQQVKAGTLRTPQRER